MMFIGLIGCNNPSPKVETWSSQLYNKALKFSCGRLKFTKCKMSLADM
jgi:hypothetical protein